MYDDTYKISFISFSLNKIVLFDDFRITFSNAVNCLKSKLVTSALNGDFKTSKQINDMLYPVNKVLFCESNPIPIKAAMYIAGLIENLEYRLPLVPPSKENMKKIENVIKNYDIKGF